MKYCKACKHSAPDAPYGVELWGYHRPVEGFNIGKKGEHKERVFFDENFNTSKQCVKKP